MGEPNEKVASILDCINEETVGMDNNERAMVLLLVMELIKCAVELDILDTLRPKKPRTCEIELTHSGARYDKYRCSACGHEQAYSVSENLPPMNYCGNCGAKAVTA